MDPFSASASVFSVVSLAIQLGDGINRLCEFLASITEAPREIESIISQLKFFALLLDDIRNNEKILGPQPAIKQALERCEAPLKDLQQIAESLVPGFAASSNIKRKWAAISAVRAKDKIAKFQTKLQAAKLDLVLARTLSADRTHHHYYQSYEESLFPVMQGLADLREMLACNSEVTTSRSQEDPGFVEDISSGMRKAISSWPLGDQLLSTLEAELRKTIQTTMLTMVEQSSQQHSLISTAVDEGQLDCEALLQRYRSRVVVSQGSAITSMVLGEVHYRTTSYRTTSKLTIASDEGKVICKEHLEVKSSFTFVPSWWTTKLITARSIKFDVVKLSTQGWCTNIQSFNVVPESSPIFEFCRQGNIEAVRHLIGSRNASVNDMTPKGWTPLHFAASRCQADICALLLQEGAQQNVRDYSVFSRTPFGYACRPGELIDRGLLYIYVTNTQLKQTIREFIKAGEELTDSVSDGALAELIGTETAHNYDLADLPSLWLIKDILPAMNLELLDRNCWNGCLTAAIEASGHAMLPQILRHCDSSMAREGIRIWLRCLEVQRPTRSSRQEGMFRDFRMLVGLSGGLCFVYKECRLDYGRPVYFTTSPVLMATRYSWAFSMFRAAVQIIGIDIEELLRSQIELLSDGWTFEGLLSLFHDHSEKGGTILWSGKFCQLCKECFSQPNRDEVSWKRRVNRIKRGIDLEAPLNEEEEREHEELEAYLIEFHKGICRQCHEKNKKKQSRWTLLG